MHRLKLVLITVIALAITPTAASAQATGQKIPVPAPILTKLGHTPMVELWDGGGGLPYLGSDSSYNAGDWEKTLRAYAAPAAGGGPSVYEQQLAKVDKVAEVWISKAGRRHGGNRFKLHRRGAHKRGVKVEKMSHARRGGHHADKRKRAIVFDVDETALSNYSAIDADDFTFGTNSQAEATNEIGAAIKPTLELYKLAQSKGIDVFFVTGRKEDARAHTAHNLEREGFTGYKQLVLKPLDFTGTTVDYKAGARKTIEGQGYKIVASVGDQYSDLAGGHEAAAFKLPNPFYFLP
jgi:HAD superfamily, subfamily IIIB (Acid phosphatase)